MRRIAAIVLAMCAVCATDRLAAQEPEAKAAKKKMPVTTAEGYLRVTGDPNSGLMTPALVGSFVEIDPTVVRQTVSEISSQAAKSGDHVVDVKWNDSGLTSPPGIVTLWVVVNSFDERVPAQTLLEKLPRTLALRLPELDVPHQIDEARRASLQVEVANLLQELERRKESCRVLAQLHKVPATPEVAAEQRARLDAQIEKISAELVGLEARGHAIESQVAQLGKAASQAIEKDPVVAELTKSVEYRQLLVAAQQAAAAAQTTTTAEVLAAEGALAEHKAELAKYRREASQLAGGQRLSELRRRLEDTAIEQAEAKAKLAALTKMRDGIGFSPQLDIQRMEVERLESAYRELAHDLDQLVHKLKLYQPPTVTLVLVR